MNRLMNCNEYYGAYLEIKTLTCRDLYLVDNGDEIYWVKHCGIPTCGACAMAINVKIIAVIKRVLAKNAQIPGVNNL